MNIFMLSACPKESAQMMVDSHTIKMVLEAAQLLSTAHRVLDGSKITGYNIDTNRKQTAYVLPGNLNTILYQASHINHPSAIWVRESIDNYNWLLDHLIALSHEYTHRYGKVHKTAGLIEYLKNPPKNIPNIVGTPLRLAMDDKYKISDDPVECYRNYYKHGKSHLFSWKNRDKPSWIET